MPDLSTYSIKANNFKCFGDDEQGFDKIKRVNVIIGRNNSGKSSLLDILECVFPNTANGPGEYNLPDRYQKKKGTKSRIIITSPLTENSLKPIFQVGSSGGDIPGNHWVFGQRFINQIAEFYLGNNWELMFSRLKSDVSEGFPQNDITIITNKAARKLNLGSPFRTLLFRRIMPDRHIIPEGENSNLLDIEGNGAGATAIIQNFLYSKDLSSELIEARLLNDLNSILGDDAAFERILCQKDRSQKVWEIYLKERGKGDIALSLSGSGLQTIILILIYILVLTSSLHTSLDQFIFGF